jgi:hypothetical protein
LGERHYQTLSLIVFNKSAKIFGNLPLNNREERVVCATRKFRAPGSELWRSSAVGCGLTSAIAKRHSTWGNQQCREPGLGLDLLCLKPDFLLGVLLCFLVSKGFLPVTYSRRGRFILQVSEMSIFKLPPALRELFHSSLASFGRSAYTPVSQRANSGHERKHRSPGSTAFVWLQRLQLYTTKRPLVSLGALLATTLIAFAAFSPWTPQHTASGIDQQAHSLYLLIPVSHPDVELCRTILTAEILGYPPPQLVHWETSLDDPARAEERRHAKLTLLRDFLGGVAEREEEAFAIILDGGNSWFQLRPAVLLSRYL